MVEHPTFWRRAGRLLLPLVVVFGYLAAGFWALWTMPPLARELARRFSLGDAWFGLVILGWLAIAALGLNPGTWMQVVSESRWEGPIELGVDGRATQVPLGLARAMFVAA